MQRVALFAVLVLAFAACANANTVPCGPWVHYSQCSSPWGTQHLGSSSNTICKSGCAMSSVAMAMATRKATISGATVNPGNLNTFLEANGGYADQDLIVWSAASKTSDLKLLTQTKSLSKTTLQTYVNNCFPVIANVRSGSHWVLVTGWTDSSLNTLVVEDPGFNTQTYAYTDVSEWIVYSVPSKTTSSTSAGSSTTTTARPTTTGGSTSGGQKGGSSSSGGQKGGSSTSGGQQGGSTTSGGTPSSSSSTGYTSSSSTGYTSSSTGYSSSSTGYTSSSTGYTSSSTGYSSTASYASTGDDTGSYSTGGGGTSYSSTGGSYSTSSGGSTSGSYSGDSTSGSTSGSYTGSSYDAE